MKTYLGCFEHFATGEGSRIFMWVFDVEEGEDRDTKFHKRLCRASGCDISLNPEAEEYSFNYFKVGFEFYNIEKAEDLQKLKDVKDSLPIRIEQIEHIWFIRKMYKDVSYDFEYYSYLNIF